MQAFGVKYVDEWETTGDKGVLQPGVVRLVGGTWLYTPFSHYNTNSVVCYQRRRRRAG